MNRKAAETLAELQQPRKMAISPNTNKLFVHGFLYVLQETWSKDSTVERAENHVGGRRYEPKKITYQSAGKLQEARRKFFSSNPVHGGSKPANLAQKCSESPQEAAGVIWPKKKAKTELKKKIKPSCF